MSSAIFTSFLLIALVREDYIVHTYDVVNLLTHEVTRTAVNSFGEMNIPEIYAEGYMCVYARVQPHISINDVAHAYTRNLRVKNVKQWRDKGKSKT